MSPSTLGDECYVFGYGSLVSPASLGRTLERLPVVGRDMFPATLDGFERRWNYAISRARGRDDGQRLWTLIALGLASDPSALTNGVVALVNSHELARLDRRESNYDRVDVTDQVTVEHHRREGGVRVVTYVPRSDAVDAMRLAAAAGEAAIERRYWDLVLDAFADLGQREQFLATTAPTELPILELERV